MFRTSENFQCEKGLKNVGTQALKGMAGIPQEKLGIKKKNSPAKPVIDGRTEGEKSSSQRTFVAAIKPNTRSICIDGEQLIDRYKCESGGHPLISQEGKGWSGRKAPRFVIDYPGHLCKALLTTLLFSHRTGERLSRCSSLLLLIGMDRYQLTCRSHSHKVATWIYRIKTTWH
ncbi:hypothetical protein CEXT_669331 [Caerostris extrusa]|uniref:Uncharacterized protein n=1 Tax=Caerostris extrusa TaxID=172846 RepID=A0AAV4RS40_CAEEX|nr:hypothetical protein CEXT_669331 [Caerostris extrusa]